jgi:hypothetical protein
LRGALARCQLGQAEIENLDPLAWDHKQVGRLDVPVHNTSRMCRIETLCNLDAQGGNSLLR